MTVSLFNRYLYINICVVWDIHTYYIYVCIYILASLVAQTIKNLSAVWETWVWYLGWEELLENGNDNPLQYSCLENSMNRGAWRATVHGVAKSQIQLSDYTFTFFSCIYICVCACIYEFICIYKCLYIYTHTQTWFIPNICAQIHIAILDV